MIIEALQDMAQAMCEVSPRGVDGMEVLLPEAAWHALEIEARAKELMMPPPSYLGVLAKDEAVVGPMMFVIYTHGGAVNVRRKP